MGRDPLVEWRPTRDTRATSGTRMLSMWHTQSHYINADSRNLPFSGNIYLHLCFMPYQTGPAISLQIRADIHTVCEKTVSIVNFVKIKYRLIVTDHLKNLLIFRYFIRESQH